MLKPRRMDSLIDRNPTKGCGVTNSCTEPEILNSYLACDWDRAVLLYNRAEDLKLKNLGEIAVLRGQFKFLFVFGRSIEQDVRRIVKTEEIWLTLESLCWEPKIYGLDMDSEDADQLQRGLLYKNGMCDGDRTLLLKDSDRGLLLDAAHDLEKGFLLIPQLPYFYRALLARSCYCVGRFHDAAEQYNILLQNEGKSGQPKDTRRLFACLNLSYQKANESARAKEILGRWSREFPNETGVNIQLAELEARDSNNAAAIEYLRKEIDLNPAADNDWKLTLLLTLGETQDTSQTIKYELKVHFAL
jgi:hypothetical protein